MTPIIPARNIEAISAELRRVRMDEPQSPQVPKPTLLQPAINMLDAEHVRSVETLAVAGRIYTIMKFHEGKGPTLAQSIEVAELIGRRMLTRREDAFGIHDNHESRVEFEKILEPGEWSYIRDPQSEAKSKSAMISHSNAFKQLVVCDCDATFTAPALILGEA